MNHLTDMELLSRIELTLSAIHEMETNIDSLNTDFTRYLNELTDPATSDENDRYRLAYLVERTRKAISEETEALNNLNRDLERYNAEIEARKNPPKVDPMDRYRGKLERLTNYVLNFVCSGMPKKTASYRFIRVPTYREACGMARVDPLEYRIDEENDQHMIVTFFVSSNKLRKFIIHKWQQKFKDLAYVEFDPPDHEDD